MNYRSIFLRVAVCIATALLTFVQPARAGSLAYFMQGGDNAGFGVVDLSTGAFSLLGHSGGEAISGLAYYNGVIYAGAYLSTPQPDALYQVNPATGSLTFIGNSSEPYADIGSTMNGVYKLGYDGNLYSINVTTGASTLHWPDGFATKPHLLWKWLHWHVGGWIEPLYKSKRRSMVDKHHDWLSFAGWLNEPSDI